MVKSNKAKSRSKTALIDLKNKITNQTLIVLSIMAVIAYTFTIFRAINFGFNLSFLVMSLMTILLWTVTFLRNKFILHVKIFTLISIILFVLISGLFQFGFLASAKMYIPIIPVFFSFMYSYKASVRLLLLYMAVYSAFAILYINGQLEHSYEMANYVSSYVSWSVDGAVILLTSWGLLTVGSSFHKSLVEHNSKIEKLNQKLIEYINMNSHQVRAPLASVLGLLKIYELTNDEIEKKQIIDKVHESAESLDVVIKSMNRVLEIEITEAHNIK